MLKPPWGPNVWMKTNKNTKTHSNESTLWLLKRTILRFPMPMTWSDSKLRVVDVDDFENVVDVERQ